MPRAELFLKYTLSPETIGQPFSYMPVWLHCVQLFNSFSCLDSFNCENLIVDKLPPSPNDPYAYNKWLD